MKRAQAVKALPVAAFAVGMVLFGTCAHRPVLWAPRVLGLVLAALGVAAAFARERSPASLLGLQRFPAGRLLWLPVCMALGVAMAAAYRNAQHRDLLPSRLTAFVILSAAIGLCEELAYRGFVQSRLRGWGIVAACLGAAIAHTAYKCSLFLLPATAGQANLPFLAVATLAGGFLFGLMREFLGSVWFPAAVHLAFDVASYGDLAAAPWWVW